MSARTLCPQHIRGVGPNTPPFYNAGCRVCEAKKAAGVVTGNEPKLEGLRKKKWRPRRFGAGIVDRWPR